jgi:hypothetical protein
LYINPLEGVLISYNSINKYPISPNYIIRLNDIKRVKIYPGDEWFMKKGMHYFSVKTDSQYSIFCLKDLDLVKFWVNEILLAKMFYDWLHQLIEKRYSKADLSKT